MVAAHCSYATYDSIELVVFKHDLHPRDFSPSIFLMACSIQKWRGKAWEHLSPSDVNGRRDGSSVAISEYASTAIINHNSNLMTAHE